jgi:hypothetical protein
LEYLEDKLRELRFVSQDRASAGGDIDQKSVLLGQLDAVRRELVEAAYSSADRVIYAKDLLKDIINFALADDEENRMSTPGPSKGPRFSSVEKTPLGKRTPVVPDSLEGSGRMSARKSPGSSAGMEWYKNSPKPDSMPRSTPSRWTDDEMKSNQRKYSTYSRTLMVSDEDIYGPKDSSYDKRGGTPDSQTYGGTVKVKELLARAEQGLSDVASAQAGRRTAPRVIDEASEFGTEGHIDLLDDSMLGYELDIRQLPFQSPAAENGKPAKVRTSPTGQQSKVVRRIHHPDSRSNASSSGLVAAIGKLAGLVVAVGGVAASIVFVTHAGTGPTTKALGNSSKSKKMNKKGKLKSKKKTPQYRGEADVYKVGLHGEASSDEAIYFEESMGPESSLQSPVINVHKPPSSQNFPADPPDVTVAMG